MARARVVRVARSRDARARARANARARASDDDERSIEDALTSKSIDIDVVRGRASADAGEENGKRPGRRFNAFARAREKDPYKRLGIDADSTSEEVSSAFNFLIREHAGDERGVEAIEAAYDRIINDRLTTRKKAKGLKRARKAKKETEGGDDAAVVARVKNMFAKPDQQTLMRRTVLYAMICGWAIAAPATSGPAFQMAVAFGTCVFFLNQKRGGQGTLGKSFRDSFLALLLSWVVGSIAPVYIPVFPSAMSPELILSLFSFVALWITCTFLK